MSGAPAAIARRWLCKPLQAFNMASIKVSFCEPESNWSSVGQNTTTGLESVLAKELGK